MPKNRTSSLIPHPLSLPRSGLTLVEMLIGMAITLVMMAAVVNLFANIGSGIRVRRASMELGTQLRTARARLFKDLAGATAAARPKLPSDDHDDGYIELIEGQYSDKFPSQLTNGIDNPGSGDPELDYSASIIPSGADPANILPATGVTGASTNAYALGDYDDILALTVRSESEPFVGRVALWQDPEGDGTFDWIVNTIESDLAEIIWFAVENPADGSNGEPGMRTVYRRVLLIAPWVEELPGYNDTALPARTINGTSTQPIGINLDRVNYQLSDVSFRQEGTLRIPNTLSDLTKRENRFAHQKGLFPHAMDLSAIRNDPGTSRNNFPEFIGASRPVLHPYGLPFEWDEAGPFILDDDETNFPKDAPGSISSPGSDRQGEDVMLNDVLAFDLRVYDPGAPLLENSGATVEPSDSGWTSAGTNPVGFGSYVDLYWNHRTSIWTTTNTPKPWTAPANPPTAQFALAPNTRSGLNFSTASAGRSFVVYDTWPYHYEDDGLDQDDASDNLTGIAGVDQGTNGLDDLVPYDHDNDPTTPFITPTTGVNGVDDASERETQPPYDHPLRAMQVKLRVYDRDTRQIREATVTRNFVPQ